MQSIDAGAPTRFRRQVRFLAEKYQGNPLIFAAGFRRQKGHRGKGKVSGIHRVYIRGL